MTSHAKHKPPKVNRKWFDVFVWYGRWYLGRHFHAVRLSRAGGGAGAIQGRPVLLGTSAEERPVIVYSNHPSWWDPMILIQMTQVLLPNRTHYAPIDAKALQQYRFFEKIGFFGVDQTHPRGAIDFMRKAKAILNTPNTALWITPEGDFTDARTRPVQLRLGVAHLVARMPNAVVLPIALEYPFWDQPKAEALVRCGCLIDAKQFLGQNISTINETLTQAMQDTMDALAVEAQRRDAQRFDVLIGGNTRVSLVYDAWRSFWARLRGKRFSAEHRGSHAAGQKQRRTA